MSEQQPVTVARFRLEHEARIAAAELSEAGIVATGSNAEFGAMLGTYVGTAFGGVQLQVAEVNVPVAREVLAKMDTAGNAPWHCDQCGEDIEAGFEVCWNCQAEPGPAVLDASESPSEGQDVTATPEAFNQNGPPAFSTPRRGSDAAIQANDDEARKAFKTTVFGVLFFPIMFLAIPRVLRVSTLELSPAGNRRFFAALIICVTDIAIWYAILQMSAR